MIGRVRRWQLQRRNGPFVLPTEVERFSAGHEKLQARTRGHQLRDQRHRCDHLLEVIEHQYEVPGLNVEQ
jgi:hypothetical protein